jgi:hypothetical protein
MLGKWSTRKSVSFLARQSSFLLRQKSCIAPVGDFNTLQPQRGYLALISEARGPRRMAEVLDKMQDFQCVNLRDKLYGILSLDDWGKRKRPDPDYAKDRIEVCVMILELYLEDESLAPLSGTYVEWTCRLHEVFEISPSVKAMREALEKRCSMKTFPETISEPCGIMPVGSSFVCRSREGSRVNVPLSQLFVRTTKRRFKDMGYGVWLRHGRHIVPGSSSTDRTILCRGERMPITESLRSR